MPRHFFLPLIASLALGACATAPATAPVTANPPAQFEKGVVSAADPRAAEAGAEILRKGGSATDAAIAVMVALTVVEPQSSGIGGGGFFVRGTADGKVETLDGREAAPSAATPDWFLRPDGKPLGYRDAVMSGLSVGVPGNIRLAEEAHRRHGRIAWAELFEPAIRLARDGWEVTDRFHMFLGIRPKSAGHSAAGKALYFDETGKPLAVGTTLKNPELAATLEAIAQSGPEVIHEGALTPALAKHIADNTPHDRAMTQGDIARYRAKERAPLCGKYRVYRVCGMGPPSSGATTVLAILGQLEPFDLASLGAESPIAWHLFAESQRLAYADRERFLADPDFIAVPTLELVEPTYLAKRAALIDSKTTMVTAEPGLDLPPPDGMEPPENGTSHFVVIDRWGNAVSYTSTIETAFGSGLMFGGFYLNNELTDFSFLPEKDGQLIANRIEGGKRPRSSMAPTLVFGPDGKLVLAIGAAGGGTIPVQVARALIGFIDWKLPVDEALALPVLYSPGDTVSVEQGSALEAMIPALEALGHAKVKARRLPVKGNAVVVRAGALAGAADPRSEGRAISE
ncbi:MAG: gamma-glutamyltransferase [Novosphingobium sp.]|nr:gamma-glutamyltransferase [Novosphingobium sp.]